MNIIMDLVGLSPENDNDSDDSDNSDLDYYSEYYRSYDKHDHLTTGYGIAPK